jgi:hypothetical protein
VAAKKNRQREEIREEPREAAVVIAEPIQEIALPAEILGQEAPAPWSEDPLQHEFFVVRDITFDLEQRFDGICKLARSLGLRLVCWSPLGYGRMLFQYERLPAGELEKSPLSDTDIRIALSL